jgi:hypothetical protein
MVTLMITHPAATTHLTTTTELVRAGAAANRAAAAHAFTNYQERRSPQTLRRLRTDLALFIANAADRLQAFVTAIQSAEHGVA